MKVKINLAGRQTGKTTKVIENALNSKYKNINIFVYNNNTKHKMLKIFEDLEIYTDKSICISTYRELDNIRGRFINYALLDDFYYLSSIDRIKFFGSFNSLFGNYCRELEIFSGNFNFEMFYTALKIKEVEKYVEIKLLENMDLYSYYKDFSMINDAKIIIHDTNKFI